MTTTNSSDNRLAPADARPVVLVRYRPGVSGETMRTVHVMPLHPGSQEAVTRALCGASLRASDIELVKPRQGMPCEHCLIAQAAACIPPTADLRSPAVHSDAGLDDAAARYRGWGWGGRSPYAAIKSGCG